MLEPTVIFENKDMLVLAKPAGLQVHGARVSAKAKKSEVSENDLTLADWLVKRHPEIKSVGDDPAQRPGIVHRLDKATSGVMVVAKTQAAFDYLKSLFKERKIKKTYLAIVQGIPKKTEGTIDAPIGIRNGTMKRSTRSEKMAKPAVTEYKVLSNMTRADAKGKEAKYSLLEVAPQTGRTHQIRVHLASIGHPIAGDTLYGSAHQPAWATRLFLHAFSLEFTDAQGKRMKFEAEAPF